MDWAHAEYSNLSIPTSTILMKGFNSFACRLWTIKFLDKLWGLVAPTSTMPRDLMCRWIASLTLITYWWVLAVPSTLHSKIKHLSSQLKQSEQRCSRLCLPTHRFPLKEFSPQHILSSMIKRRRKTTNSRCFSTKPWISLNLAWFLLLRTMKLVSMMYRTEFT